MTQMSSHRILLTTLKYPNSDHLCNHCNSSRFWRREKQLCADICFRIHQTYVDYVNGHRVTVAHRRLFPVLKGWYASSFSDWLIYHQTAASVVLLKCRVLHWPLPGCPQTLLVFWLRKGQICWSRASVWANVSTETFLQDSLKQTGL